MNPWTPLLFATLGWGTSAVLTRAAILEGVDSYTLVPVRMVFAMVSLGLGVGIAPQFWSSSSPDDSGPSTRWPGGAVSC